jgi:SAM-dependent methyltransferase
MMSDETCLAIIRPADAHDTDPVRSRLRHREATVIDGNMRRYYERGRERERLTRGGGTLELVRTQELLRRYLPSPPADVLDVGGGPGVYAAWLAQAGYRVHLVDPLPLHVEQAAAAAAAQPNHPFTAAVGDARRLDESDTSCDATLLFGPLYHLTERAERIAALAEARRVLRPGGLALVVAISRFGSLLDGLRQGILGDPEAAQVIERTLRDGQHRNPGLDRYPGWFTTAYFHLPAELAAEVTESGLILEALIGIEGPGEFVGNGWDDPQERPHILRAARVVEREASLLGVSAHLLAVARKSR